MEEMEESYLLGIGFDGKDGHLRITRGKNFRLYGGSEKTHEAMQKKAIKFNEALDRCGKTLDEITVKEFVKIANIIESKQEAQKKLAKKKSRGRD